MVAASLFVSFFFDVQKKESKKEVFSCGPDWSEHTRRDTVGRGGEEGGKKLKCVEGNANVQCSRRRSEWAFRSLNKSPELHDTRGHKS